MKEKSILKEARGWNLTTRLRHGVQGQHERLAAKLGKAFSRFTRKWQLGLLAAFFTLCVGSSTCVFLQSLHAPQNPVVPIDAIRQPAVVPVTKSLPLLTPAEYHRLHNYRLQLDSGLQRGDTALALQHDTLLVLEQLYLQQLKK